MTNVVQIRRGDTATVAGMTLLAGELAVDTTLGVLVIGTGNANTPHAIVHYNAMSGATATDVDRVAITGSPTGSHAVSIAAVGSDANIDLNISAKGSGVVNIGGQPVLDCTVTTPADGDMLVYDTGEFVNKTKAQTRTSLELVGKQSIWVPAVAMYAQTTNPAASGTVETGTNDIMVKTWDFDTAADENVQFSVAFPKGWNEGTVSFVPYWSHPSTTTNFGVAWFMQGVALSNDDALDTAMGTAVGSVDTGGTTDDLYVGPESSAITIAGTPAAGDQVFFRIYRDVSDAGDTLAVDARLHGVKVIYTIDAAIDD